MTRSIYKAAYLAIFLGFLRKLVHKVIVPKVADWSRAPFRYIFTAPMGDFELLQGGSDSYAKLIAMTDGNNYILSYYRYNGFNYVDMDTGRPLDVPVGITNTGNVVECACRNTGRGSKAELDALCREINNIQGF